MEVWWCGQAVVRWPVLLVTRLSAAGSLTVGRRMLSVLSCPISPLKPSRVLLTAPIKVFQSTPDFPGWSPVLQTLIRANPDKTSSVKTSGTISALELILENSTHNGISDTSYLSHNFKSRLKSTFTEILYIY